MPGADMPGTRIENLGKSYYTTLLVRTRLLYCCTAATKKNDVQLHYSYTCLP